ncbi:MAG: hypothetical protein AAGH15_13990 [Myxococcota bacterium]
MPARRKVPLLGAFAVLLVTLLAPRGATAQDLVEPVPEPLSRWALDLTATTSFPLEIGGGLLLEVPGRLLFDVRAGVMPSGYVRAINSALIGAGLYGEEDAETIENAIQRTFLVRAGTGFRIGRRTELLVGYTRFTLGGTVSSEVLVGQTVGLAAAQDIEVDTTIHAVHASLGGRFVIARHVVLRVAFEWVHTVSAFATADFDREDLREEGEAYVEDALESYGFVPTLRVSLGWRAIGG